MWEALTYSSRHKTADVGQGAHSLLHRPRHTSLGFRFLCNEILVDLSHFIPCHSPNTPWMSHTLPEGCKKLHTPRFLVRNPFHSVFILFQSSKAPHPGPAVHGQPWSQSSKAHIQAQPCPPLHQFRLLPTKVTKWPLAGFWAIEKGRVNIWGVEI